MQWYVGSCTDFKTGKGRPTLQGKSPGNFEATYPFQIIVIDHISSLLKSHKGKTEMLIRIDLFTGYVMFKASASWKDRTVAEGSEECVFRRFGASKAIRHDLAPGLMSDFFRALNHMVGHVKKRSWTT